MTRKKALLCAGIPVALLLMLLPSVYEGAAALTRLFPARAADETLRAGAQLLPLVWAYAVPAVLAIWAVLACLWRLGGGSYALPVLAGGAAAVPFSLLVQTVGGGRAAPGAVWNRLTLYWAWPALVTAATALILVALVARARRGGGPLRRGAFLACLVPSALVIALGPHGYALGHLLVRLRTSGAPATHEDAALLGACTAVFDALWRVAVPLLLLLWAVFVCAYRLGWRKYLALPVAGFVGLFAINLLFAAAGYPHFSLGDPLALSALGKGLAFAAVGLCAVLLFERTRAARAGNAASRARRGEKGEQT